MQLNKKYETEDLKIGSLFILGFPVILQPNWKENTKTKIKPSDLFCVFFHLYVFFLFSGCLPVIGFVHKSFGTELCMVQL